MEIEDLIQDAIGKINGAGDAETLESVRIELFGRSGRVTQILRSIGTLPPEERGRIGQEANKARKRLEDLLKERKKTLSSVKRGPGIDTTLPGVLPVRGAVHPIHKTIAEIAGVFSRLGFDVVKGREIETEFHNFTALNIPPDHPSRDGFDTFYTRGKNLLRSQTSTVQIRIMEKRKPPLRILAPGRVYRPDTVDASHSFMFHQIEGLMVDEETTFGDLKGVINTFLHVLFGKDVRTRFRPSFFPFTEPSAEVDVSCILCAGKGCPTCGRSGWLEVLGAGMVDPEVFRQVGYPKGKYQGFAFGLGVERIAMLRHKVRDIRLFFENDINFLSQFS